MTEPFVNPEAEQNIGIIVKDIITVLLLIIGTILITVGTSLFWSVPLGLTVLGAIVLSLGLILGLRR